MKRFQYNISTSSSIKQYSNDTLSSKNFYKIGNHELFTDETLYRIVFKNGKITLVGFNFKNKGKTLNNDGELSDEF